MKPLPEYIQFSTPELALACVAFLTSEGWTRDTNIPITSGITTKENCRNGEWSVSFDNKRKVIGSWESGLGSNVRLNPSNATRITSLQEFSTLILEPPILIGEFLAEIKPTGVQVGCTFVPWETIELLLSKKP